MASSGNSNNINPNPWGSTYDSYRDCSKGICSIYCPQWCYTVYPPPPPFDLDADSGTDFSPLIIAVIGILASAFVLVFYYTVISRYCRGRSNTSVDFNQDRDLINGDQGWNNNNNVGLDDAVIKSITVFKYKKNDGLIDGTDCSVCLSEFQEDDSLRLLPKCSHAFHLPCIDTWLKSHSSCPLCRANINFLNHTTGISIQPGNSGSSVHRYQHQNDVVSVIEDVESGGAVQSDSVVNIVLNDDVPKTPVERESEADDRQIRRSMSLNSSFSSSSSSSNNTNNRGSVLLVADILRSNEDGEEGGGDGDSTVEKNYRSRVMNMVRSVSTGRFMFGSRYGKGGNSSVIPQ